MPKFQHSLRVDEVEAPLSGTDKPATLSSSVCFVAPETSWHVTFSRTGEHEPAGFATSFLRQNRVKLRSSVVVVGVGYTIAKTPTPMPKVALFRSVGR